MVNTLNTFISLVSGEETEHPEDWLELVTCADVTKLAKVLSKVIVGKEILTFVSV